MLGGGRTELADRPGTATRTVSDVLVQRQNVGTKDFTAVRPREPLSWPCAIARCAPYGSAQKAPFSVMSARSTRFHMSIAAITANAVAPATAHQTVVRGTRSANARQ
jgi:hypothetical protein